MNGVKVNPVYHWLISFLRSDWLRITTNLFSVKEFEDEIEFNENQISKYKSELSNYRSRIEHENAIYAEVGLQSTF